MERPAQYRITMLQGSTFDRDFVWRLNGTPVNLTNYTAQMEVRKDYNPPTASPAISLTKNLGIFLGSAGQIKIFIAPSTTVQLPGGSYRYNLELIDNLDSVTRLLEGSFVIYQLSRKVLIINNVTVDSDGTVGSQAIEEDNFIGSTSVGGTFGGGTSGTVTSVDVITSTTVVEVENDTNVIKTTTTDD